MYAIIGHRNITYTAKTIEISSTLLLLYNNTRVEGGISGHNKKKRIIVCHFNSFISDETVSLHLKWCTLHGSQHLSLYLQLQFY